ncbi:MULTISPECIES: hypothetical protein [Paenibacillus]|uniref:Uncharacterized protein n=1 Tax=Paenibacillus oleatilyticus TaxID=2594886 RepID=A0ABV4UV95_9BACL|nr:hypothetical protein [Paenibacillus elgii]
MLMEWLEPAIEKRTWEVLEICEDENKELISIFTQKINELKNKMPASISKELNELEEIFIQKNLVVRTAYRIGFEDGVKVITNK